MIKSGNFRDRVEFQRLASSDQTTPSDATDEYGNPIDGYGNSTGEYAALFSVWGDIRETPGKEALANGALESTRTATLRVRYSDATADITAADRVSVRGSIWNIRSGPVQINRVKNLLEFTLEAGVAT